MKANKGILIDAPDIRIVGSNLRLTARNEFTISAKVMGGIVAGFCKWRLLLILVPQYH